MREQKPESAKGYEGGNEAGRGVISHTSAADAPEKTRKPEPITPPSLKIADMHCHLNRFPDPVQTARDAMEAGIAVLCATTSPADARDARKLLGGEANIRVAVGLHPWEIAARFACDECEASAVDASADEDGSVEALVSEAVIDIASSRFVGEIGMDLSPRFTHSKFEQYAALEQIAMACAERRVDNRVITLHAVRSADIVLDVLERFGLTASATCVFHWFSGTSDDLVRLRKLGCKVSINDRMLATKRGREYARQLTAPEILLETDMIASDPAHRNQTERRDGAPDIVPGANLIALTAEGIENSLERTLKILCKLRGDDLSTLRGIVLENSMRILGY